MSYDDWKCVQPEGDPQNASKSTYELETVRNRLINAATTIQSSIEGAVHDRARRARLEYICNSVYDVIADIDDQMELM